MKRFYMLLLASAVLCTPAHAYDDPDDSTYNKGCVAKYCFDDEVLVDLTPAEQQQLDLLKVRMARIIANAGERMERRRAYEEQLESVRRSQCSMPLLWVGCPPRTAASELYWKNHSQ